MEVTGCCLLCATHVVAVVGVEIPRGEALLRNTKKRFEIAKVQIDTP